jgi:hypothetical protein
MGTRNGEVTTSFFLAAAILAACSSDPTTPPIAPATDAGPVVTTSAPPVCPPPFPVMARPGDAACPVAKPARADAFDDALARAGLDRCTLGYTAKDWSIYPTSLTKDAYRLPWYDDVHDHAMRVPGFGRFVTGSLDDAAASRAPVAGALQVAAFALGGAASACPEAPTVDETAPLASAVLELAIQGGSSLDGAMVAADAADVPLPLQRALAPVVLAIGRAEALWTELLAGLSATDRAALVKVHALHLRSVNGPPAIEQSRVQSLLAKRFDLARMAGGAIDLALAIERADLRRFAGLRGFDFEQETPFGRIVIRDAADNVHGAGTHVALLVDTGGADTYTFPAGAVDGAVAGTNSHVGIAIDLAGADHYGYGEAPNPRDGARLPSDSGGRLTPSGTVEEDDGPVSLSETPRQGAARLGYGMLFDYGADGDSYRALRLSQGYGAAGAGVLYDEGGNDRYEGEAGVQGAAHFGVGLVLDMNGNDTYRAYSQTQGFASVRAVGVLYDANGNDHYLADNGDPDSGGDPLYWTPQIPGKGNNSFAQGSAWGRRAPSTDDVDMSGGLGVLRDRHGNDEYVASVQSQASGYWFGTGILADGDGSDTYDARYYVQGAGAHFAMALFLEEGGDDRYNQTLEPKATSIGVGHDFTVAWHLDLGGDDRYRAPTLSLGSGNANGIGVLVNVGGTDVYVAEAEPTLGAAQFSAEWHEACEPCHRVATTGIFLDVDGADQYEVTSPVTRGDEADWTNPRSPADYKVTEHSAGADRSGDPPVFP